MRCHTVDSQRLSARGLIVAGRGRLQTLKKPTHIEVCRSIMYPSNSATDADIRVQAPRLWLDTPPGVRELYEAQERLTSNPRLPSSTVSILTLLLEL